MKIEYRTDIRFDDDDTPAPGWYWMRSDTGDFIGPYDTEQEAQKDAFEFDCISTSKN